MSEWIAPLIATSGTAMTAAIAGTARIVVLRMRLGYLRHYCQQTEDTAAQIAVTDIVMRPWSRQTPVATLPR